MMNARTIKSATMLAFCVGCLGVSGARADMNRGLEWSGFSSGGDTGDRPFDLPLGGAVYTPGDFNGDGRTDLVITTSSGSYWYFSNGNGSWSVPYQRSDLPLGAARYAPGDFNGDGRTDLVITTSSGSYWYFSHGDGTWNVPYQRQDL